MFHHRKNKLRSQISKCLVLCGGKTEQWYLSRQLKPELYKIELFNKGSAALQLVQYAQKINKLYDYEKIYCVFDRDKQTNPDNKLEEANTIIIETKKLVRIFSNPCFEMVFLFNFIDHPKVLINYENVETELNKQLPFKYSKNEKTIDLISKETDFNRICSNAKHVYMKLGIDDKWIFDDGYSEIFKLTDSCDLLDLN